MHWGFVEKHLYKQMDTPLPSLRSLASYTQPAHSTECHSATKPSLQAKNNHESGAAMTEMTQTSPLIWEQLLTDHGG